MRRSSQSVDQLQRPDGNGLQANYELHDVGMLAFEDSLWRHELIAEEWGIDLRHDDGKDGLVFDDKMDCRIWSPNDGQQRPPTNTPPGTITGSNTFTEVTTNYSGEHIQGGSWELIGIGEVKTKSSEDWMGIFNLRHLVDYATWASKMDVPVFIYFAQVDESLGLVEDNFVVPVSDFENREEYVGHYHDNSYIDTEKIVEDCPLVERTFGAGDGNKVVVVEDSYRMDFDWFVDEVL